MLNSKHLLDIPTEKCAKQNFRHFTESLILVNL